jgi:hypothetical protein
MGDWTKIIDYHLVTMWNKERGYYDVKLFDRMNKLAARKAAKEMELGRVFDCTTFFRKK